MEKLEYLALTLYILLLTNRELKFMFSVTSVYLSSDPMQGPNSAFPEHTGTDISKLTDLMGSKPNKKKSKEIVGQTQLRYFGYKIIFWLFQNPVKCNVHIEQDGDEW